MEPVFAFLMANIKLFPHHSIIFFFWQGNCGPSKPNFCTYSTSQQRSANRFRVPNITIIIPAFSFFVLQRKAGPRVEERKPGKRVIRRFAFFVTTIIIFGNRRFPFPPSPAAAPRRTSTSSAAPSGSWAAPGPRASARTTRWRSSILSR